MRRVDLSKRRVLNIRQARKMQPIDKFNALKNRKKAQPSEYQVAPHAQQGSASDPASKGSAPPPTTQKAVPAASTKATTP